MQLNDAVHAVTGEVFRDGWSRVRGSMQGLHVAKQTQLVRAAAGHRPAVFKAIRGGGTHTKSQLANQLDYLTVGCHRELTQRRYKMSLRFDPCGTYPLTRFVGGHWSDRHGFSERHSTLGTA
jgi:hypothetical protein